MRTLFFYAVGGLVSLMALVAGIVVGLVPGGRAGLFFIARLWGPAYLWSAGARLEVRGDVDVLDPSRPYVFAANHGSYLDVAALFVVLARFKVRFVAKRELMWIPLLNFYIWRLGCPVVDRGRHARAVRTMSRAVAKIRGGTNVLVFAEGTRTKTGHLLPFKKGAAVLALQAQVPVVPVTLHGSFAIKPKTRLTARPGPLVVHVGRPIPTEGRSLEERDAVTGRLRTAISDRYDALGGPPTAGTE